MSARASIDILSDPPPAAADARIAYGPEPLQFADLRVPAGPGRHPLVVVVHGGYWQAIYNAIHAGHLCEDLKQRGIATWNVEYRSLGVPNGEWPTPLVDVRRALDHVPRLAAEHHLDPARALAIGHSAGGQLALLAAARGAPVSHVVSLAGVVDPHAIDGIGDDRGAMRRLLGGAPGDTQVRWRDASVRKQLPLGIRYVLACGTCDVHWQPNVRTAEEARSLGDDVELLPVPHAGHFELVDPAAEGWSIVRNRIEQLIRSS